jgi:hypothetical protein
MWVASVTLFQTRELCFAILGAVGLESSMDENKTPKQGILLDVYPWASGYEVSVCLRHRTEEALSITHGSTIGRKCGASAIGLRIITSPASTLEMDTI